MVPAPGHNCLRFCQLDADDSSYPACIHSLVIIRTVGATISSRRTVRACSCRDLPILGIVRLDHLISAASRESAAKITHQYRTPEIYGNAETSTITKMGTAVGPCGASNTSLNVQRNLLVQDSFSRIVALTSDATRLTVTSNLPAVSRRP